MSHPERPDATRPGRRFVTAVLASLVAAAGLLAPTAPTAATAAELPGAITSVTTQSTSVGYNSSFKLSFAWAVPDTAVAGDSFELALPDELTAVSLATFPLLAPDGVTPVAWAAWSGKTLAVTLTDYVDTHDGVGGTGFVSVRWDHASVPQTSQPIRLEFASNAIEVVIGDKPTPPTPCTENCQPPKPADPSRALNKGGSWADSAYEGTRDPSGNINWTIRVPGRPEGYVGPITIVDTPDAASIVECATIKLTTQQTLERGVPTSPVDPARYTVDCAPGGFTVTLDEIKPAEFISITYKGTITDQRVGVYGNRVTIDIPGQPIGEKLVTMRRTAAGGDGSGTQSVAVGDLVWLDANRDGLQSEGEAGIPGVVLVLTGPNGPVSRIDGSPVGPVTTDADGRYLFDRLPVLAPGQHYTVTIDEEASAAALADLLPTTAGAGDDRGLDSSTGTADSASLVTNGARDLTLDFGFVTAQLPTLPLPEEPGTSELASTGQQVAWPAILAALAAALMGGVLILTGRRTARR